MRKDWVQTRINSLLTDNCIFVDGDWIESKDQDPNGTVRLIQLADIGDGVFRNKSDRFITHLKSKELNCTYLKKNDILVARMPEPLGRACLFLFEKEEAFITVVDVAIIRLNKQYIDEKFILHMINAPYFRGEIDKLKSGSTRKRISRGNLATLVLPLAPLLEQKVIVAKIEQLFSELDNGIANLKAAQAKLKIYRQAVLKKAFSGELTKEWREKQTNLPTAEELIEQIKQEREEHYKQKLEEWQQAVKDFEANGNQGDKPGKPKRQKVLSSLNGNDLRQLPALNDYWRWSTIDNFISFEPNAMKAGPFGSSLKKSFYTETGYKIYGQEQVISGNAFYGDYYVNEEKYQELLNCKVKPNDILISLVGTVGKVLILPENAEAGIINPRLIKVELHKKYYLPKFFKYYFESGFLKNIYKIHSHGATMDIITMGIIQSLPYPICSLEEQNQIVQEIESRLSVCDKIEETIEAALSKSEAIRQSILKKAFEGRLLSAAELENIRNHPDYESAHVLLARIKQEKSQASQPPPQKQIIKPAVSTDIHAGLIAKIIQAHQDNGYMEKLSHVKCEKIAHLVEYHIGVALGREPVKDAAGPDDYPHLKKVEHRALKVGYFSIQQQAIGHSYLAGRNIDKAIKKFEESIDVSQNNKVNDLINLFLKFNLEQSEIVATLYAAWNNLLLAGKDPDDEEIVYEARENWSSRKLNIDRDRFFKALQWMRQKDISLLPRGAGLMVAKH